MSNVELKSRAKRILTIPLPSSAQSPRFPLQRMSLRRSKIVKHQGEPVPHDVDASLPSALTIMPGEIVRVPKSFLSLEPLKNAMKSREVVMLREVAEPKRAAKPAPPPAPKAEPVVIAEDAALLEAEPAPKDTPKKRSGKARK